MTMPLVFFLLAFSQVYVIAHRGEHLQHPENSIAAIESAAVLGADFVELDVRTSQDGKLVLMHDKTVDRTTAGHGQVKDLSGNAIAQLQFSSFGGSVPSFDEALDAAKGKIKIYLDWKDATPEAIFHSLSAHGMIDAVVVYGDLVELHRLQELAPGIRVMPEADSLGQMAICEETLKPSVVAFDNDDFKLPLISEALDRKEEIFVDRLGEQDTPAFWQDAIDKGARAIQTNNPGELIEFLRKKNLHP